MIQEQEKPREEKEPTDVPKGFYGTWIKVGDRCCNFEIEEADPEVDVGISFVITDGRVTSVTVTADMTHHCGIRGYQIKVSLVNINPAQRWEIVLPGEGEFFPFDCPDAGGENQQFSRTWDRNMPNRLPINNLSGWTVFSDGVMFPPVGPISARRSEIPAFTTG